MAIDISLHAGLPRRAGHMDWGVLATMRDGGALSVIADIPAVQRDPNTKRLIGIRHPWAGGCLAATEGYLGSAGVRIAGESGEIFRGDPALVLVMEGCDGDPRDLLLCAGGIGKNMFRQMAACFPGDA
jgi:hypothetical protein